MANLPWIEIRGHQLFAGGRPIVLRGYNLGNWLLLEEFMIGLHGVEMQIFDAVEAVLGQRAALFWETYEREYFTAADAELLRKSGVNVLRLPLSQWRFEDPNHPGQYREAAFAALDRVVQHCKAVGIYTMIDLHAVSGGQSREIYAGSVPARPEFWSYADHRRRAADLLVELARRYANEPAVAGYDLLNEPQTEGRTELLAAWYRETLAAVRAVDERHVIWLESDDFGGKVTGLPEDLLDAPGVTLQFHRYPLWWLPMNELTAYPQEVGGVRYDRDWIRNSFAAEIEFGRRKPLMLGETGLSVHRPKSPLIREMVRDFLAIADEEHWSYALWTYKDVGLMGWLAPRADTPWKKLLASEHTQKLRAEMATLFQFAASMPATGLVPDACGRISAGVTDNTMKFAVRGAARLLDGALCRAVLEPLRSATDDEVRALAASFSLGTCEVQPLTDGLMTKDG